VKLSSKFEDFFFISREDLNSDSLSARHCSVENLSTNGVENTSSVENLSTKQCGK
jgi:hypothetical protein